MCSPFGWICAPFHDLIIGFSVFLGVSRKGASRNVCWLMKSCVCMCLCIISCFFSLKYSFNDINCALVPLSESGNMWVFYTKAVWCESCNAKQYCTNSVYCYKTDFCIVRNGWWNGKSILIILSGGTPFAPWRLIAARRCAHYHEAVHVGYACWKVLYDGKKGEITYAASQTFYCCERYCHFTKILDIQILTFLVSPVTISGVNTAISGVNTDNHIGPGIANVIVMFFLGVLFHPPWIEIGSFNIPCVMRLQGSLQPSLRNYTGTDNMHMRSWHPKAVVGSAVTWYAVC